MNKKVRELLDRRKEENRLIEEQKKQNIILKEEKKQKKEEKIAQKVQKIENRKSVKIVAKEIKKEIVSKPIIKEEKIQKNYNELKKRSVLSDKFINLVDNFKIDDKNIPKTIKGMETKTKEILSKINKKLEKIPDEEFEIHYMKKKKN